MRLTYWTRADTHLEPLGPWLYTWPKILLYLINSLYFHKKLVWGMVHHSSESHHSVSHKFFTPPLIFYGPIRFPINWSNAWSNTLQKFKQIDLLVAHPRAYHPDILLPKKHSPHSSLCPLTCLLHSLLRSLSISSRQSTLLTMWLDL